MRTTISLDDALLAEAKQTAARTGRSLTAVIEDALRSSLTPRATPKRARPALPSFRGDGLQPGVDLDDSAALLDLLDEPRAAG